MLLQLIAHTFKEKKFMGQLGWRMGQVYTVFLVLSVAVKNVVVDITS